MGNGLWTCVAWVGVFSAGVHLMGEWRRWRELPTTTLTLPTGKRMSVELANTREARSKGLSQKASLVGDGLLLLWSEAGHHPIWMADMRFPSTSSGSTTRAASWPSKRTPNLARSSHARCSTRRSHVTPHSRFSSSMLVRPRDTGLESDHES